MPRLSPNVEVRPLGGAVWYGLLIAAVVGLLLSTTLGGALVWILFWFLVLALAYFIFRRLWGRAVGR